MKDKQEEAAIFEAGRQARRRSEPKWSNPYDLDKARAFQWAMGWIEGDIEAVDAASRGYKPLPRRRV